MSAGQNIGVSITNNVISQNPTTYTITVGVYYVCGKKLIEGVMLVNSVHGLVLVPITYSDP